MALNSYNLIFARSSQTSSVIEDMQSHDLLKIINLNQVKLSCDILCFTNEFKFKIEEHKYLFLCEFLFETHDLEHILRHNFNNFLTWFFRAITFAEIDFAFIFDPTDANYLKYSEFKSNIVIKETLKSVFQGSIKVIHPFLFFSEKMVNYIFKKNRIHSKYFRSIIRNDVGTLLIFSIGDLDTGIDIMDFGILYQDIIQDLGIC